MVGNKRHGSNPPRYLRLLLLPSARALVIAVIATTATAVVAATPGPSWASIPVVVGGTLVTIGYFRHHRRRLAVEFHMARSLLRSTTFSSNVHIPELISEVRAETTSAGVVRIDASSWLDAVRALGFVMMRDRGFQLDLLRRTGAGRLAAVLGRQALASDEQYRAADLVTAAQRATAELEAPERELLTAFTEGANAALTQLGPPFECRFLSYQPAPWAIEDSVLLALFMFHTLSWTERQKRADAVIRHTFPEPVTRFLLAGGRTVPSSPPSELREFRSTETVDGVVAADRPAAGSNCWVVRDPDRTLLACDLHLPLMAPNLMYELDLRWSDQRLQGLAVAGLPVALTGTNGHVAWGVTDLAADVLDLAPVEEPTRDLRPRTERIGVRGKGEHSFTWASDGSAPVARTPLMDTRVAIRWTGHSPRAGDLKFQRLAHTRTLEEGIDVVEDADGIALNVLIADDAGRMAQLAAGLLPRRHAKARSNTPDGYLTGAERPRIVDPSSGILVSANDAALPQDEFRIGYDVDPGYRADRIRHLLEQRSETTPEEMRALQHDLVAEIYLPYRDIAVEALDGRGVVSRLLTDWDGRARAESRAFGILVQFRAILAERVLSPYFTTCRDHDPTFVFSTRSVDLPLLSIIRSGDTSLLPAGEEHRGWSEFLARCVDEAVEQIPRTVLSRKVQRWGRLNAIGLTHPLTLLAGWADRLLNVSPRPQSGALHCVRACAPGFGAAGRAVLSPGTNTVARFETPGGQSGHPLSRHFADRHRQWARATASGRPPQARITENFVITREPAESPKA